MAHVYGAGIFIPAAFPVFYRLENFFPTGNDLFFYAIKHGSLYIAQGSQLFYVVAGFFCCYIVYPMMKKSASKSKDGKGSGRIPFHFFIFKRYLRTAPVLIFTMILIFASDYWVFHPITREAIETRFQEPCETGWWKTLLMINNYDKPLYEVVCWER